MIVAVDTGGTKTLVAVFDTDGSIVAEQKFPTPQLLEEYITQLTTTIDELRANQQITCISVALPGTIVDGIMTWAANIHWGEVDIRALLSPVYDCPVVVENDANLAGLAEARVLEPIPQVCLYLTVSTGIGTGVIVDGKIHPRLSRVEGGRIMLKYGDDYQIWELFASGKAIHETYGKLASEIEDDETWSVIADNIAQGMLALTPFLKPDIVVIGGGVGTYLERFSGRLEEQLRTRLIDGYMPTIVKASHPEQAVIYGCYYHALDTESA